MSRSKLITNLVDSNDETNPKDGFYTLTTQEKVTRFKAFDIVIYCQVLFC